MLETNALAVEAETADVELSEGELTCSNFSVFLTSALSDSLIFSCVSLPKLQQNRKSSSDKQGRLQIIILVTDERELQILDITILTAQVTNNWFCVGCTFLIKQ